MTVEPISMRNVFGDTLTEMTLKDKKTVVLDGDLGNSTRLAHVEKVNPDHFLQMGIAEQNMVGVASGLSTCGLIPWVCSFGAFITRRAYDQIVVSVDQPSMNVKLVGAYSGLLTSNTGKTHHSLEDIALMATLPNMVVLSPGDAREVRKAMEAVQSYNGPVYLRLSRDETLNIIPGTDREFKIGKCLLLNKGKKIACLSTGAMSSRVYQAVQQLKEKNIEITHVHFPTVKPLDKEMIMDLAKTHEHFITVEEHFVTNGFGSLVNEVTSSTFPVRLTRIGVEHEYSQCGKDHDLLDYHGLTVKKLIAKCQALPE